jgi:hypothetical protein
MRTTFSRTLSHSALVVPLLLFTVLPSKADGTDCVVYATDYANGHVGSGDMVGDAVSGGMTGAVVGGQWNPLTGGAARGARTGAALGVLNNLGSVPQGWQALYDMAYQICTQQNSGASAAPYGAGVMPNCRSSASVDGPSERSPDGGLMVGSGGRNCR